MKHYTRCLGACALTLYASFALAGTLASDVSSYLGIWHGSTPFQGYDLSNNPTGLSGRIEWAVYAPGTFPAGFLGYTPTSGEAVYAYQAFVDGPAPLSSFSVNLVNPANNIGTFSGGGVSGDAPSTAFLIPFDSANWLFDGVPTGGTSEGLVFSSPKTPMFSTGTTIDDGSVAAVIPLPSPDAFNIPEPATSSLAFAALVGFAAGLLRRHKYLFAACPSRKHQAGSRPCE